MCALERELESKDRSGGGRSKIRRVTKGKSGSKARKGAGTPKVDVGDELSELECLEQVAFRLEKQPYVSTLRRFPKSAKLALNPQFSSIFAEDPPAERLSSSFPPAGSASGSAHEKDRDEEIG